MKKKTELISLHVKVDSECWRLIVRRQKRDFVNRSKAVRSMLKESKP